MLTLYQRMSGHFPKFSYIRVRGYVCCALMDEKDPQRHKLKPTSFRGFFIGYCESNTQYLVYIPSRPGINKVMKSANVQFLEDSFGD